MKKKVINLETNNKEENDSETKTHDEKAKEVNKLLKKIDFFQSKKIEK